MKRYHSPILTGRITSRFGPRGADLHAGVDVGAPHGDLVYATDDGWCYNITSPGYGIYVDLFFDGDYINHLSVPSRQHMARYAHLSKSLVSNHQKVKKGDPIGLVGSTGNSTGPHLHFELHIPEVGLKPQDWGYQPWRHGVVDPMDYIEFVLNGKVVNPLYEDWRIEQGRAELKKLFENGLISNLDYHLTEERLLGSTENWLFWIMLNRVRDEQDKKTKKMLEMGELILEFADKIIELKNKENE